MKSTLLALALTLAGGAAGAQGTSGAATGPASVTGGAAGAPSAGEETVEFRLLAVTADRQLYVAPQYLQRDGALASGVFLDSFPQGRRMARNVTVGSAVQVIGTKCDATTIWTESSLLRAGPSMTGGVVGLTATRSPTAKVLPGSIASFQRAVLCGNRDALRLQHDRVRLEHPEVPATLTVALDEMRGVR